MDNPEANGISRRHFLKIAGAFIGGIATGGLSRLSMNSHLEYLQYTSSHDVDPELPIYFDRDNERVSFDELAQFHRKLGRTYIMLDLDNWYPHLTDEFVQDFVKEIARQLLAEDIAQVVTVPTIKELDPTTRVEINHLLGYTDCKREISENSGFTNEASHLYDSPWRVIELVHETVHLVAQGYDVCHNRQLFSSENVEATAQIGMLEVLASMVNRGNHRENDLALRSFLFESYVLVDGALEFLAYRDDRMPEYEEILRETENSIFDQLRNEKWRREVANDPWMMKNILEKYYFLPWEMIIKAHRTNHDVLEGVALPPRHISYYPDILQPATLVIDDWAALMAHLDEVVDVVANS